MIIPHIEGFPKNITILIRLLKNIVSTFMSAVKNIAQPKCKKNLNQISLLTTANRDTHRSEIATMSEVI